MKSSPPARVVWCVISLRFHKPTVSIPSAPARVVWIEMSAFGVRDYQKQSPPARVVWIEMYIFFCNILAYAVATREGGVD